MSGVTIAFVFLAFLLVVWGLVARRGDQVGIVTLGIWTMVAGLALYVVYEAVRGS